MRFDNSPMTEIFEDKKFQSKLASLAEKLNKSIPEVRIQAKDYIEELYSIHHPLVSAIGVQGAEYILGRGYDKTIDVNPAEIKELSKLMRRHPIAFVMTHKTYIDMFVLGVVLARHGLPLPFTFSGINMAFFGLGELGRRAGAIFIRRSFKDNEVYKLTLKHFISHLVDRKSHFMWAIEGTRSRTGKIVWPKMGILKYIVDAEKDSRSEVKYVPVSIVYDLIPDVQDMVKETRGKNKNSESLMWFLNYVKKMGDDFGKISLRIGKPVELDETPISIVPTEDSLSTEMISTLPKFAFELVHKINTITPVTTASLVCTSLLSKFALKKKALEKSVVELMQMIESHKPDALVDRGKAIGQSVQSAVNLLSKAGLVQQIGEGPSAKYSIVPENYLTANYYSNMGVHHLYHRAFIELAIIGLELVPAHKRLKVFWNQIMDLRDLFKFEFFYSNRAQFSDEIEHDLNYLDKDWFTKIQDENFDVKELLTKQPILVCPVVLGKYLEAYQVVATTLKSLETKKIFTDKELLANCLFIGEEMHWKGQIHRVESVSKPFVENGIRLAQNKQLVPTITESKTEEITDWLDKLKRLSARIKYIQEVFVEFYDETTNIPIERNIVPGSKTDSITEEVLSGERGPHIGAFFDLDRTLIKSFSAKQFFQNRLLSGKMTPKEVVAQTQAGLVYALGNKNFAGMAAIGAQGVKGIKEKVFIDAGEEVYLNHLAKEIFPESRALVNAHLEMGHTVAIISAATPYQAMPIARDLGIDHIMCTRMEVEKGRFTGQIIEPACWGDGKAAAARDLTKKLNLDLSKSHFYTDSAEDMPLMDIVGHPHPVNPDTELSSIAYQRDWPIFRFDDDNPTKTSNILRTLVAFGGLIPVAAAGFFTGTHSLSFKESINNMIAVVGDLGTQLAGITLVTKGKENLWSSRPAVFIFNHQSNVDFLIVAKLLRRDVVGIAKKELTKTPIGPLFKMAGIIFIDRKNKEKAIEALKPAVDALKSGTSIGIAPEGTRSYDYKLGKFKKGAFHLAMQAKVPIVPIVITNAHDVMPRGTSVLRPSVVEVKVLEPIQTHKWKRKNIDKHVEEVRNKYLKELGQDVKILKKENRKAKKK